VLATADVVVLVIGSRQEQLRAGLAQLELLLDELAIGPERLRVCRERPARHRGAAQDGHGGGRSAKSWQRSD